ncbi:MAG: chorismate synthase [Ruminococcaceae bacterium]|nr:chorismate synthase [Oscillospiraceae bacterium]
MSVFHGKNISVSIFGQSHSEAIGVVIEGLPSGITINEDSIKTFMKRRAASSSAFSTQRKEGDEPVFISGVLNGKTTGAAVCVVIYNKDQRSKDYSALFYTPRPGHADYTARIKYCGFEDTRGGGAFSGRMTAPLCIAGAIAKDYLEEKGVTIGSHILSVSDISEERFDSVNVSAEELKKVTSKPFGTVSDEKGRAMLEKIAEARNDCDSLGGVIECAAVGVPAGYGGEIFDGIESTLAKLVFSVPAVKGFEIGAGFDSTKLCGSENNDPFYYDENGVVKTFTNNHGGILGGMTSGMPIIFRAAIKPTPSIAKTQKTVNLETKENTEIEIKGRHDSCIVPRALPVMESCLALAVLDELIK